MTNRRFDTTALLALFALLAGLLAGCSADESPARPETVTATLSLRTETGDRLTKAVNDESAVNTLDVYILDGTTVEQHLTQTDFTDGKAVVELTTGRKTICAVANAGNPYGSTAPENEAADALNNWLGKDATAIPMSTTLDTTWTVTSTQTEYEVRLNRMVAKMNVKVMDERGNQTPAVSSVTIDGLLAEMTNLYRKGYGVVALPDPVEKGDWTLSNAPATDGETFYLHENTGTFPVTVKLGENTERTGSFTVTIPRNHIFPLVIHLTDYSLSFKVTYQLAAIGTLPVSKISPNTYNVELPEGCTYTVEVTAQNNSGANWSNASWTWGTPVNGNASITVNQTAWPDGTAISDAAPTFTFTGAISAQHVSGTCDIPVTLTDNGKTINFTIKMSTLALGDEELMSGVTTKSVYQANFHQIDIDL